MTYIEYKVLSATSLISQKQCNELGLDGWVLTTIIKDLGQFYFYFFRVEEVKDTQESTVTRMDNETPSSLIH
jgi:hypothetical protein